ncbi:ribose-5-phosphate isomerase RpiA [Gracilibacillus sp. S3-1-1]|uniref:Ribose-5-phosphate isomerase RpiA n=1 Tax=Gracilibacillus pellucidus TaxID=3095368 RepID=A0ACC6M8G2_9BACI|nr:ribose-5-phosphate isomerase RpiA [Gracilibacillus sp. S3-1-1]MDX8047156.1 ribose-5-phosphate isomerase RpiA [Gracilibacillus sp. S3-1-1]
MLTEAENNKKKVGEAAVAYVKDGMTVGLGAGSTVNMMVETLAKHLHKENIQIHVVPASIHTERLAKKFGIPLTDFSEVEQLDLMIDGADEVDQQFQLLKGGGGSLVREKIIASAAQELLIMVDESKLVATLGRFPLPVEILPFGWELTAKKLAELGAKPKIRGGEDKPFVTDNQHYILDCSFGEIPNPQSLHNQLKGLVGVVETGLFVDMVSTVLISSDGEVSTLSKK